MDSGKQVVGSHKESQATAVGSALVSVGAFVLDCCLGGRGVCLETPVLRLSVQILVEIPYS